MNLTFAAFFDAWRQTTTQPKRRNCPQAIYNGYESLEAKRLLAANIFYDASTDIVTVISDSMGDRVDVTYSGSNVAVSIEGGDSQSYAINDVVEVKYFANGGNDSFYNATSINTLFVGGDGADYLSGGTGSDTAYAGDGADTLYGGDGADLLNGGNDNDLIYGEDGNDQLHGSWGDDEIHGGDGDDYVAGEFDNDTLYGDAGVDFILGSNGNDELFGGDGNDFVYGQGDDDVVRGEDGDDRVRGNNGNDTLYGGDGNDFMMSDAGDDFAYGESGNDRVFAFSGTDYLDGGDGNDEVIGEQGTNTLLGGNGQDTIIGGTGVDYIFGESGDDLLYGRAGNDEIDGGLGVDRLLGEEGDDALYGGEKAAADQLVGGAGNDRYLIQANDIIEDQESIDAVLEFIDVTSDWTDAEIVVMKSAFRDMYNATGNNLLIQETLNNDNLEFHKYAHLNGNAGINYLTTTTSWYYQNGQPVYSYTYDREIHFADWDETSSFYNDQFAQVMIHELAHNWDSETELNAVASSLGSYWNDFMALSGWTDQDPNSSAYTRSNDNQWWYLSSSQFAENYGRTNPNEDMATIFEYYFENGNGTSSSNLDQKLNLVDAVFSELALLA
ncbi:MAG: calcium-binding protein [Planctomycetota bacterium]